MRISKAQKYEKEQYMIQQEIIGLLGLEEGFYLYEMDRDSEKINAIMEMVPEIWKYFAHMNVTGLLYPEKCKRPWLSIVRGVLKNEYRLKYKPCRYNAGEQGSVFTMKYFLERRAEDESSISDSDLPSRPTSPEYRSGAISPGRSGTLSSASSYDSLCSLDEEIIGGIMNGSQKKRIKVSKKKKAANYQIDSVEVF